MEATQRKSLAKRLAELGATERPIAKALGVAPSTIHEDLTARNRALKGTQDTAAPQENGAAPEPAARNRAPSWYEIPQQDIVQLAETRLRRAEKDAEREEKRKANEALIHSVTPLLEYVQEAVFDTIVIDPPWDWGDEGDVSQLGRGDPLYNTEALEELERLPVASVSKPNAHLYLWITNRSLPKGFRLLEKMYSRKERPGWVVWGAGV